LQGQNTAPSDPSHITKQAFQILSSMAKWIYKCDECSCVLACPAGGASGRAWSFWFFLHQGKKNI